MHVIARLGDHAENEHSEAKLLIEYDRCAYIHERNAEYQVERTAMCRCVLFADVICDVQLFLTKTEPLEGMCHTV